MKQAELLTEHVSFEDMTKVFVANNPGIAPNRSTVGRFAKKCGYKYFQQMINKQFVYFYIKNQENNGN